jgi:hypothetical protein
MEPQRGFEIATKVVPVNAENPDEISEKTASDIADYLGRLNGPPAGRATGPFLRNGPDSRPAGGPTIRPAKLAKKLTFL